MAGENRKRESVSPVERSMTFLFGEEIKGLYKDGYEGSEEEHQIFMEFFSGKNACLTNKSSKLTKSVISEPYERDRSKANASGIGESTIFTSQSSQENSCKAGPEQAKESFKEISREVPESGSLQECSSSWAGECLPDVNAKRLKLLSGWSGSNGAKGSSHCSTETDQGPVELDKLRSVSTIWTPRLYQSNQQMPCFIVESFCQGLISSYYLPFDHGGTDFMGNTDDDIASGTKNRKEPIRNSKGSGVIKTAKSPVSQESFVSNVLGTGDPGSPKQTPGELVGMNQKSQRLKLTVSDPNDDARNKANDDARNKAFCTDLPLCLRSHANNLLLDAGFRMETQRRKDRVKLDTVFRVPEGGPIIRSLSRAWRECGSRLLASSVDFIPDEDGREWVDVDVFWYDLSDTLAYIEEAHRTGNSLSVMHRWQLLDPFVTVVCIEHKITALREGKLVKVVKGAALAGKAKGKERLASPQMDCMACSVRKISQSPILALGCFSSYNQASSSSHLLHPVGGMSQSTSPAPETNSSCILVNSLSHVVSSFSESVKVTTDPSNQKKACESIALFLGSHSFKHRRGSWGANCKLKFSGEVHRRSLRSLARSIGNGSLASRGLHGMKWKSSSVEMTPQNTSSRMTSFNLKGSAHSKEKLFANGLLSQRSIKTHFGTAFQTQSLGGSSIFNKRSNLTVKETGVPSYHKGKPLIENGSVEELAIERKVEGVFLKENFSHGRDETCRTVLVDDFKLNQIEETGLGSWVSEGIVRDKNPVIDKDSIFMNADSACLQEPSSAEKIKAADILSQNHLEENDSGPFAVSRYEKEDMSSGLPETDQTKKPRRKSKKISEIKASKLSGNDMKANLPGKNTSRDFSGKISDSNTSRSDLTSDCLKQMEVHEQHDNSTIKSLIIGKEETSLVSQVCLTAKASKKMEKLKSQAAESCNKVKQHISSVSQDADTVHTISDLNETEKDNTHLQSRNTVCSANIMISQTLFSANSSNFCKTVSDLKKFSSQGIKLAMVQGEQESLKNALNENGSHGACLTNNTPPGFMNDQKVTKIKKSAVHKENGRKRKRFWINDDDLLIAAVIKSKDFCSNSRPSALNTGRPMSKVSRKLKSQKVSCKLLLRTTGKGGKHSMDGKRVLTGARTVLAWLVDSGVVPLNDTVQYRNLKKKNVVKDGWATRDGILCKCCTKLLSVSDFKIHAGYRITKPCLNLFLGSGRPYSLCQFQAWSAEYKSRKGGKQVVEVEEVDQNDDTCGVCGDGGELICCDSCPSTFHQECLPTQDLPEGSWYCWNCTCQICGDAALAKEASCSLVTLECLQCRHKYHKTCLKEQDVVNHDTDSSTWFCGESCQKLYSGLRSGIGVLNHIADGLCWTILRCNHGDLKVQSAQKIALMAECNIKLAISLTIMEECFLPMVDPRTGIDMIPHVLYNWGSNFARLNYEDFYTLILEKDDEVISVASIRMHGVTVAEMPLIATCSEYRRQGMCRRLMVAVEEWLRSFKVEMLVLSAIPDLVDTWTSGFGFMPIQDEEKQQLSKINLMLFPGTVLLKKRLYKASEAKHPGEEMVLSMREDLPQKAEEPADVHRRNLSMPSPGNPFSSFIHSDHGFGTSSTSCNENIRTRNGSEACFSTEQAIASDVSNASVSSVMDSSVTLSQKTLGEFSPDQSSNRASEGINDIEGTRPENKNSPSEDSVMDGFRNKEKTDQISVGSNVIEESNIETETSQGLADGDPPLEFLNFSKLNIREIESSCVSVDGSIECKEKECSIFAGSPPVANMNKAGDFEACGNNAGNSSSYPISNFKDLRSGFIAPDLKSSRVDLNQVRTTALPCYGFECTGAVHASAGKGVGEESAKTGAGNEKGVDVQVKEPVLKRFSEVDSVPERGIHNYLW